MRKPKILFVTESSFLATGYGTYTKELLTRLHATGKYELAEYACYASVTDPRQQNLPWRFYGNEPARNQDGTPVNPDEQQRYDADQLNQLGKYRFEAICLDFQPDIVADFRDEWYFAYQGTSPFRDKFYWVIQPAVDSEPQKESWLETFSGADAVLTYQRWSEKVLRDTGLTNVRGYASPGVDHNTFFPVNKKDVRKWWGLPEDAFIVGMASRSQPRKLYPDLLEYYRKYLDGLSKYEQGRNYLHLHTYYPDLVWDFPRYLKRFGLSHKVLFTYICYQCGVTYISLFQDARTVCKKEFASLQK
jgi:glycosyltransferase involved in cell wall biosynthesis